MTNKTCTKCGIYKDTSEFSKDRRSKSGTQSHCKLCQRQYQEDNSEHLLIYGREYRSNNREYRQTYEREYRFNNKESIKEYTRQYQLNNRKHINLKRREYYQHNTGVFRARKAKRRARKLNATPPWSETEQIKQFYINCPKGMEVDHIIPLQGKNVSGLHVLSNLCYLSKSANRTKGIIVITDEQLWNLHYYGTFEKSINQQKGESL